MHFTIVYVQGWNGFHKSFSPTTVRRCFLAGHLVNLPSHDTKHLVVKSALIIFSPAFAMGFIFAPKRRLLVRLNLYVYVYVCICMYV